MHDVVLALVQISRDGSSPEVQHRTGWCLFHSPSRLLPITALLVFLIYISQCSVATTLWCSGILDNHLVATSAQCAGGRILKM